MMPPYTVTFTLAVIFANHVAHSIQANDSKTSSNILEKTSNSTSVRPNLDRVARDTSSLSASEHELDSELKSLPSSVDFNNKYVFDYFNPQSNSQSSKSDVDKRKWSSLVSWGKRGDNSVAGFTTRGDGLSPDNSLSDDGLLPLKKWSNIAAWGKRHPDESNSLDKKWSQVSSWGKRSGGSNKWRQTAPVDTEFGTGNPENPDSGNEKRWSQIGAWGKRNQLPGFNKRWNNQISLWGKRVSGEGTTAPEKKWSQVSSWGKKRSDESMAAGEAVKKWRQMGFWGKRDQADGIMGNAKRWSQVSAWGKRDLSGNPAKKWSQVSAWGKRDLVEKSLDKKWSQVSSWGKRDSGATPDKKWSQVSSWGKRFIGMSAQVQAYLNSIMHTQPSFSSPSGNNIDKKWKTANFWGKRGSSPAMHNFDKKWMSSSLWGKRNNNQIVSNSNDDLTKRWSQVSSWGKRAGAEGGLRPVHKRMMSRPAARWGMWGKRPSWSQTGFTSWGKRSGQESLRQQPSLPMIQAGSV